MNFNFLSQFKNKVFIRILAVMFLFSMAFFLIFNLVLTNYFEKILTEHLEEMREHSQNEEFARETHQMFMLALSDLRVKMYFILGGLLILVSFVCLFISFRLTKNLRMLTEFVQRIDSGDTKIKLNISSNDEFRILGDYVNKTFMSLKENHDKMENEKVIMESIITNLSDGIVMFNEGGEISIINKTSEKILGIDERSVANKNISDFSRSSNIYRLYEMMGRSIEEGWIDEHLSIWKDGKTKVYPVKASSVVDKDGFFWGFLAFIRDI